MIHILFVSLPNIFKIYKCNENAGIDEYQNNQPPSGKSGVSASLKIID